MMHCEGPVDNRALVGGHAGCRERERERESSGCCMDGQEVDADDCNSYAANFVTRS